MNTRSFLKSLATIVVAPQILIPRLSDAYRWRRPGLGYTLWAIDPAYSHAEYEVSFITDSYTWKELNGIWVHQRKNGKVYHSLPTLRYAINPSTGIFERAE